MSMHSDPVGDLEYDLQQYPPELFEQLLAGTDVVINLRLWAEGLIGFCSSGIWPATKF
jgi:hypothetical protein